MAHYRCMVSTQTVEAPLNAGDTIVNTFYLDTDPVGPDDEQVLADDIAELFAGYRPLPTGWNYVQARLYDLEPTSLGPSGPPTAVSTKPVLAHNQASGPQEVALCLSYYAGQNQPRKRGRMYVGPWATGDMTARPPANAQAALQTLANGISGLGGIDVQWVQFSPTARTLSNVTNWWVDNEWDTVRSRGLKGTQRDVGTVSG